MDKLLDSFMRGFKKALQWIYRRTMGRLYWKVKKEIEDSGVITIARRYFVMNAFDGALTMLGVIIGAYVAGVNNPRIVISAGIGGSLAMGISGFCGAYMTERAERIRRLKRLENAMLTDLNGSIHMRASLVASIFAALVDGMSPAMSAIMSIIPFVLALIFEFPIEYAFASSVVITLLVLFGLGAFLGKISQESLVLYGLLMVAIGIITAFLCMFLAVT